MLVLRRGTSCITSQKKEKQTFGQSSHTYLLVLQVALYMPSACLMASCRIIGQRSRFVLGHRITSQHAWTSLRQWLLELRAPRALEFRTHDFRRGHAKDLQLSGVITHVSRDEVAFVKFCQELHYGKFCLLVNGVRRHL